MIFPEIHVLYHIKSIFLMIDSLCRTILLSANKWVKGKWDLKSNNFTKFFSAFLAFAMVLSLLSAVLGIGKCRKGKTIQAG